MAFKHSSSHLPYQPFTMYYFRSPQKKGWLFSLPRRCAIAVLERMHIDFALYWCFDIFVLFPAARACWEELDSERVCHRDGDE